MDHNNIQTSHEPFTIVPGDYYAKRQVFSNYLRTKMTNIKLQLPRNGLYL